MSKQICVRLKFFFKSTRISYSTKKSEKYRTQKDDKAKNIFQGDLRGYYVCDATMIKKKKKEKKKERKRKKALDKKSEGE